VERGEKVEDVSRIGREWNGCRMTRQRAVVLRMPVILALLKSNFT
jgi:hypothetical protein